jgi:hypothetical protein
VRHESLNDFNASLGHPWISYLRIERERDYLKYESIAS